MTPEQQRRVRDLFEAALDRESAAGAERSVSLEAADDPFVRDEVLSLLAHHSRAGAFLSQPVVDLEPGLLADDDALAPGTVIGTYTIVREIGRGGMGRVYLASDARLGRTVALKALAPHLLRDAAQRERLRREARAAASLTHPGICTVYALEEIDGDLFIASEFVDGHTLRHEIASGRRPASADVVRTARELAAALAAAHAMGVVHRDLKPDNVMRTRDGRLKILDFGLARIEAPHAATAAVVTQPGIVAGTPAYMAPEQINGEVVGSRADARRCRRAHRTLPAQDADGSIRIGRRDRRRAEDGRRRTGPEPTCDVVADASAGDRDARHRQRDFRMANQGMA